MLLFKDNELIGAGEADGVCVGASGNNRLVVAAKPAAGQKLDLVLVCLEGGDAVFDIDLAQSGASVSLRGIYLCCGDDRLNITVNMRHSVGESASNQLFKGIAGGHAKVRFDGKITVAPDAQKTEAFQTSRNLLLSDDAVVETLPQLEIYADDVKCSHGATVGKLDEDEQFYMRSRGISLEQARRLQMLSFISPVIEGLPEDVVAMISSSLHKDDLIP